MIPSIVRASRRAVRRLNELLNRGALGTMRRTEELLPPKRLLWHRDQIGACSVQLEERFLALSAGIEMLSGKSDELVLRSRELLKLALGRDEDGSTFQAAVDMVEAPLDFSNECLQIIGELAGGLEIMSGRISKLGRFRNKLDRGIAPLRLLQTMFRIESATCSPEIQALFTSISVEIERLQSRMSTMVSKEFEAIGNTQATLNSVRLRLREIHAQQTGVATRRAEIENSLLHLQKQVGLNEGRDVRLIGVIEVIAAKVGEIVTALQYQDILSQRLGHVSNGLSEMATQMQAAGSLRPPDLLSFLRDASRVESAQLAEIERLLNGAIETLDGSLRGISLEIGELNEECVLLKDIESASVTGDGMVQILLDAISETRQFNESTYAQTDDICRALEPIAGLVGGLTESILEVSIQIRLIALNAQVQAVQAGEGTGLEVLSARTCSISEEITDIVAQILSELTTLKDGLKGGLETIEHTRSRNLEFMELLRTSGRAQELQLHQFRDRAFAELHSVQALIAEVQNKSKNLCSTLDVRTAVFEVTGLARTELTEFSNRLPVDTSAGKPNARFEERARSYTAAGERATSERALRGGAAIQAGEGPVSAAVEGSVEFF